jgi:hypothetical protein
MLVQGFGQALMKEASRSDTDNSGAAFVLVNVNASGLEPSLQQLDLFTPSTSLGRIQL